MNLAHAIAPLALIAASAVGIAQAPRLVVESDSPVITFRVAGPQTPFVGGVLLSLSPDVTHYLVDLPPLLSDFAVLGIAYGEEELAFQAIREALPIVTPIYAQGVVFDGVSVQSTEVTMLLLEPWAG